jgi:hypothetical protein
METTGVEVQCRRGGCVERPVADYEGCGFCLGCLYEIYESQPQYDLLCPNLFRRRCASAQGEYVIPAHRFLEKFVGHGMRAVRFSESGKLKLYETCEACHRRKSKREKYVVTIRGWERKWLRTREKYHQERRRVARLERRLIKARRKIRALRREK